MRKLIRTDFTALEEDEAEKMIVELVKERVVGGKVKVLGDQGEPELADLEPADIDSMPAEMINRLYADMTGVKYDADPLGETETETESSAATDSSKHQTTTSTTETQSSEE
ncbi:hypothetical protein G3I13_02045 [Streptomyces sp. SID6673]|nr:hypothetical protein [Streptomyces sp. SID11726]NDZ94945.1 hypothetical protein [Streptomyces sp. SID11726]NEB23103.1 hypothetical protein [Streptomyces sp. SID6673]